MKKDIQHIGLLSFLLVVLSSCYDFDYQEGYRATKEGHYLYTHENDIWFDNSGGAYQMNVESINTSWKFKGMDSWLTATPSYGTDEYTDVELNADANVKADVRVCVFKLESDESGFNYSEDITASQYAAPVYIYIGEYGNTKDYIYPETVSASAQRVKIPLYTNTVSTGTVWYGQRYNYNKNEIQALYIDRENNFMEVELPENTGTGVVRYEYYLSDQPSGSNRIYRYFSIDQAPANVSTDLFGNLEFSCHLGSADISVTSDIKWTAECDVSWLEVSPAKGEYGVTKMKISVLENSSASSRRATIILKNEAGISVGNIQVNQKGMSISSDVSKLEFDSDGTAKDIKILSDMDWTVLSKPVWVKLNPESGKLGSTSLSISCEKNNSVSARSGKLQLGKSGSTLKTEIEISQSGLRFSTDKSVIYMGWAAGSSTFAISVPGDWTAASDSSWLTLSQYSGSGESTVTVNTTDNATEKARLATITVKSESEKREVLIYQTCQIFTVDAAEGVLTQKGGSVSVSYQSNVEVSCEVYAITEHNYGTEWISYEQTSENKENSTYNKFLFTATENPYSKTRGIIADMKPKSWLGSTDKTYRLRIEQTGRQLRSNVHDILFFSKGGYSQWYNIEADGEFDISFKNGQPFWLSIELDKESMSFRLSAMAYSEQINRNATLVLSLKGLPDGDSCQVEIPIRQYASGTVIDISQWGEDVNWGPNDGNNKIGISIDQWGEDKNWNL